MHGRFLLKINQEEDYNKTVLDFLKQKEIQIYSTNSDLKAVFVERFNKTLLDLIKKPMCIEGKACWLNHLMLLWKNIIIVFMVQQK